MAHPESIIHKLFSLPEEQKEIKFQDLVAVMNYTQSDVKSTAWDILELHRGLYPTNTEQKNISATHPTVSDAVNSLSDQIATYQPVLNRIYQAIDANNEASTRVMSQVYEGASKIDRLKHKLFLERMRQLTHKLNTSFDSALNEMEQIDQKHRKSYECTMVCGLPRGIWFKIFNFLPQDLYGTFIRATCFSFNVIMRELKASQPTSQCQPQKVYEILSQAAANGQLSYVKFLHGVGRKLWPAIMVKAASSGNIDLVKFIHEQGVGIDWSTVYSAARSGNFEVFSYAREHVVGNKLNFAHQAYATSCLEGGNIEIIKYALESRILTMTMAEESSSIICRHRNAKEIIELLMDHGAPKKWKTNDNWTWWAVINQNVVLLKYLVEQGFEVHVGCSSEASSLECVQYLFERGFKGPKLIEDAARVGKLDILKFGYEVGQYPLTSHAMVISLYSWTSTCFEYLLDNNCQIVTEDLWRAVGDSGDERHVKLLLAKGVEFDSTYFSSALRSKNKGKNKSTVLWVAQQGLPLPIDICDLAANAGHLELLKYVHSLGKPFGKKTVEKAAESFNCLKYVLDHGAELSGEALLIAAVKNNVPSLELLLERNCPIPEYFEMCLQESGNAVYTFYNDYRKRAKK